MGRRFTLFLLPALMASAYAELPPNVAKTARAAKATVSKRKPAAQPPKQQPQEAQPTPAQPVVPLRPSQLPSVAPKVSYQQGKLTVVAENSTLADIFAAVRAATGIRIETQGGPSGDRVAAKIGPGSPREVLLSILQGSRFDYVMLGAVSDPDQIERVILTPRSATIAASTAPAQAAPPQPNPNVDEENNDETSGDEDPGFAPVRGPEPQPAQQQPAPNPNQPSNAYPPQSQALPAPNGEVKTPEQLLEDLRRIEEQRRLQTPNARDSTRPR